MHGQYPMKNTQMIVDNHDRAVAAAIVPVKSCETTAAGRCPWCMRHADVSFLVRELTKLLRIVFSIVDNAGRRYDSCIVANQLSLPSNP
jgi:hypothetical protein